MVEIQIFQTLAESSPALLMLVAFVYYARDAQRREREAREDFTKREAELRAEAKHHEEILLSESKRREEILIAEFQRREASLISMLNACSERFDKISSVLSRLENWLKKTD